jgi:murein DD-endopeptidase MepM/ murein hydrolase activator NlpD
MATGLTDRILTIVVTATLTSAFWIVAGGSLLDMADSESQRGKTRPAEAAPTQAEPSDKGSETDDQSGSADAEQQVPETAPATLMDQQGASQPKEAETRGLMVPVLNIRPSDLVDTFSILDEDGAALHEALDIPAPEGTSVVAAAPGTIEKLFVSRAGGKTIYVRSADRLTIHYYAHLGEYAEGLKEGQRVRRGQRLGSVGSSGNASPKAPHLHFAILRTTADAEWWEPANAVNPFPMLTQKD